MDYQKVKDKLLDGLVYSHIEGWKSRYEGQCYDSVRYDLYVNHDPSIEIEIVEEELGRELTHEENEDLVDSFNEGVLKELF